MKRIKDFEWKAILLSDIFDFDKGNQNNMGAMQNGNIPLVSAKKCDNGYKAFISENGKKLYDGHCITLNNDGDGGAGLAYYQPTKMALDSHVTALIPKFTMSKYTMLFIARSTSAFNCTAVIILYVLWFYVGKDNANIVNCQIKRRLILTFNF